ncbi:DUF6301 family protein [Nocardia sp. NPDC004711]
MICETGPIRARQRTHCTTESACPMYVESDKVEHIVSVAASFDWTWTAEDLPTLCVAQGWEVTRRTDNAAVRRTDHMADRPEAYWCDWDKGGIRDLIMVVTDRSTRTALRRWSGYATNSRIW